MTHLSAIAVRRAGPRDATAVVAMARAPSASVGDPADRLDIGDALRHMLAPDGPMVVGLAEIGGETAGHAFLLPAFGSGHASPGLHVADLHVEPTHRRAGVGRHLLAEAARLAAEQPGTHLWPVMKPGDAAARFHRAIADVREEMVAFAVTGAAFARLAAEAGGAVEHGAQGDG